MTTKLDKLKALMAAATPGPWEWQANHYGDIQLATPDRGRLIVMDFVRRGMQSAEPRFAIMMDDQPRGRRGGIMHTANEIIKRNGALDHPDASLIVDAINALPALIAAVEALNKSREDINWILNNRQFLNADTFDYIDAALAPFGENDEQKD